MRPSEYKEEYVEKVNEYLESCVDNYDERGINVNLPKHEGFASFIGVATSSLYAWEKDHPDFSKALSKIKQEQKSKLVDNGLANKYNSTIAKLILSSNHGMAEKTESNVTANVIAGINYVKPDDQGDNAKAD